LSAQFSFKNARALPVVYINPVSGLQSTPVPVEIDTGAAISVAPRRLADALGLDLLSGQRATIGGVTGAVPAYVHNVGVRIGNIQFDNVPVAIATENVPFLLGRKGIWGEASLGFDTRTGELTITPFEVHQVSEPAPTQTNAAFGLLLLLSLFVGGYFLVTN